jgi:hypothetical protein
MNGARKRFNCLLREDFFVWTVGVVSLMEGGEEDQTVRTQIQ